VFGRLFVFCAVTLAMLGTGCTSSDQERKDILQVLAIRTRALNSRDLRQYLSVVSPQYNDKGKNFARLEVELKNNFRDIEQISYLPETPEIHLTGTHAESVTSYRMKVLSQGKEIKLNGAEHLKLAKEPGGWKIIAGI
jgi:hypothetical protein